MNTQPTKAIGSAGDVVQAMSAAAQQLTVEVEAVKVITTRDQYQQAGEIIRGIDILRKDIEAHYDPICAAAYTTHKMLTASRKGMLDPLLEKRGIASRARLAWENEQERLAFEERQKLEAEAQKQHEEAALAAAVEAEQNGDVTQAQSILAAAVEVPSQLAVRVEPDLPKTEGVGSRRTVWDFEVTDPLGVEPFASLIREVAGNYSHLIVGLREAVVRDEKGWHIGPFIHIDEVAIGKLVRGSGEGAKAILGKGVRLFQKKGDEARGRS